MLRNVLERLVQLDDPVNAGQRLFEDEKAVMSYLSENNYHLQALEVDRLRWELGVGLGLVCGVIVHHRRNLMRAVGPGSTLFQAFSKSHAGNGALTADPDSSHNRPRTASHMGAVLRKVREAKS